MDKLEKLLMIGASLVTIIGFPLLFGSLWFAYRVDVTISRQLSEIKKIAQSENSILLNTMLFNDSSNADIIHAIQNDKPILTENGGNHSHVDLDKYLGGFDTVALVYRDGFLSDDHLCSSFSYDIDRTSKNSEVQKYLAEYPDFFDGLRNLIQVIDNNKSPYCAQQQSPVNEHP